MTALPLGIITCLYGHWSYCRRQDTAGGDVGSAGDDICHCQGYHRGDIR